MKPLVINNGITTEDFAGKVHHEFEEKFNMARILGQNV